MVTIGITCFNVTKFLSLSLFSPPTQYFHVLHMMFSLTASFPRNRCFGLRNRDAFIFLHCMDFKILLDVTSRICSNTGNSK